MPGETHQIIQDIDADTVMALLQVLLDPPEEDESGTATLADLGIDDDGAVSDVTVASAGYFGSP